MFLDDAFSRLKVRFGEYDARGFKIPETKNFTEIPVSKIVKHPQFSSRRLFHDVTVLACLFKNIKTNANNFILKSGLK